MRTNLFLDGGFGHCFFVKQKTAYELRISDWSSDVCSSDLGLQDGPGQQRLAADLDQVLARNAFRPAARRHDRHDPAHARTSCATGTLNSLSSSRPQRIWPSRMWHSWMRAVTGDGTQMQAHSSFALPPLLPVRQTVVSPRR